MGSHSSVMAARTGKGRSAGVSWGWTRPPRGRDYSCFERASRDLVIEGLRAVGSSGTHRWILDNIQLSCSNAFCLNMGRFERVSSTHLPTLL